MTSFHSSNQTTLLLIAAPSFAATAAARTDCPSTATRLSGQHARLQLSDIDVFSLFEQDAHHGVDIVRFALVFAQLEIRPQPHLGVKRDLSNVHQTSAVLHVSQQAIGVKDAHSNMTAPSQQQSTCVPSGPPAIRDGSSETPGLLLGSTCKSTDASSGHFHFTKVTSVPNTYGALGWKIRPSDLWYRRSDSR
eukprot:CAMPEP_0114449626 /NCGR_PEP_ID=MMETSP0104-20121206/32_1 /TAXON_ID=37642 ORGANISM="Paraphysomonas imperforata, Strain PA2" /NCGR_SAMPLE_ID=MMETSP0104 /ASSEMBLY_ACC=CAM_ASM_000202 /LENGTH=191 /DNA_ID=CAMNT_0001621723 /DNA_START=118 /DNA_END=695 /DNA_ORIENTATION=-